jgi:hypothetical protein
MVLVLLMNHPPADTPNHAQQGDRHPNQANPGSARILSRDIAAERKALAMDLTRGSCAQVGCGLTH